jgi:hypothetical protein
MKPCSPIWLFLISISWSCSGGETLDDSDAPPSFTFDELDQGDDDDVGDDTQPTDPSVDDDDDDTQPTDPSVDDDGDGFSDDDGDCDDGDASIHPDAHDVWRDGVDQDCPGRDRCSGTLDLNDDFLTFDGPGGLAELQTTCADYPDGIAPMWFEVTETESVDLMEAACLCETNALVVIDNAHLISLEGLGGLLDIEGSVYLYNNDSLPNLRGLENLEAMASDLSGSGSVSLGPNAAMTSLEGLESLHTSNNLSVALNGELTSIAALSNLTTVGVLNIQVNPKLESLEGLEGLTTIGDSQGVYDGFLWIDGNGALTDLGGLDNITDMKGDFILRGNSGLTDLTALSGLVEVQSLTVDANDSLVALTGLEGVDVIGVDLEIRNHDSLTDVTALHSVSQVGQNVEIVDNTALPAAAAQALVDAIGNIPGSVTISGNAP